jgi:DNA-binding beta-propeller fold protein YncE
LPVRLIVVLGLLLAACLLLAPASASASGIVFKEDFGSANEPSFTTPEGLAVDQASGDLLVIDKGDKGAGTVSRFHADGTPAEFTALGSNVISGLAFGSPGEVQVAVDNSGGPTDGDIYVPQAELKAVNIYDSTGAKIGQLTESSEGKLHEPCGVAVDPSGNVYVGDFSGAIHKYEPAANPPVNADNGANFAFSEACTAAAGAAATSGFLFVGPFGGELKKLGSGGGEEEYPVDPGPTTTETVDPANGHVLAASTNTVREYDASGPLEATLLGSFSPGSFVVGIAVNGATGDIYVSREGNAKIEVWHQAAIVPTPVTEPASAVGTESATLNGTVNPNGLPLTECFFEYDTVEYEAGEEPHGKIAPCEAPDATEVGSGSSPVTVHADVEELSAGTNYHFRLAAKNANGRAQGEDEETTTLGPVVSEESVSQITGSGAKVGATIDPHGKATSFVVQYVTQAQFEESAFDEAQRVPAIPRELSSETEAREVFQQLSGLSQNTTYRFRFVATNGDAEVAGADRSFATFAAVGLPDERAYEMVSPPKKVGEVFAPDPTSSLGGSCQDCLPGIDAELMPMQSAPDGEAVVYTGQPFGDDLASGANEYLASRSAGGWGTEDLSEPRFGTILGQGYQAFSADLSRGIYYQADAALSPEAPTSEGLPYANLYLREGGVMRPLVVGRPPRRDSGRPETGGNRFRVQYAGANSGTGLGPAFTHVAFEANDGLTGAIPGIAPAAPEVEATGLCSFAGTECDLYEWVGGQLRLVNVLPDNETTAGESTIGAGRLLAAGSQEEQYEAAGVDRAISADGSRIFWSSEQTGHLYVRVNGEETLEVPGPGSCNRSVMPAQRVCFLTASADGRSVLLTNGQIYKLNEGAAAYEAGPDLTDGLGGFEGILGTSEDLSRVYFVDAEALTQAGEANANGEHAEAGKHNLYAWSGGSPMFIGQLLGSDNKIGEGLAYGAWKAARSNRTAQVPPDGRFLAFMSQARLTGYDNGIRGGGECSHEPACFEVFEYAADSATLVCASCNPSGQRPAGRSSLSLIRQFIQPVPPFPQPGNLSAAGEGRLFFESSDVLSSADTNGATADVYEWEPLGVGSCSRFGGCVALISSGNSPNDSMFLDSTPSGDDAFFVTRQRLLPRDENSQLDLYDARAPHTTGETVGFPEGSETVPCGGEACKGPLSAPPPMAGVGSGEFDGLGNFPFLARLPTAAKPKPLTREQKLAKALRTCSHKRKARRRACRAYAKKLYGPHGARSTSKSHKEGS